MTNNNWIETMKTIGKISSIHPEIVDEFILITKDLLTKKDQEHKTELESIKGEIENLREPNLSVAREQGSEFTTPRMYRSFGGDDALQDTISILDGHINKLSTE